MVSLLRGSQQMEDSRVVAVDASADLHETVAFFTGEDNGTAPDLHNLGAVVVNKQTGEVVAALCRESFEDFSWRHLTTSGSLWQACRAASICSGVQYPCSSRSLPFGGSEPSAPRSCMNLSMSGVKATRQLPTCIGLPSFSRAIFPGSMTANSPPPGSGILSISLLLSRELFRLEGCPLQLLLLCL